ncbi:MAG: DUF5677 domain-containing protein [Porticoccaceae bacterium]
MNESSENYAKIYNDFSLLLEYGERLIELQVGTKPSGSYQVYGERIFVKLLCHGKTLKRLSPTPGLQGASELWDISSNYAIARTLIETFDALAYIAIENTDELERDFRIKFWKLHSEARRLKMLTLIGSQDPRVEGVRQDVENYRAEILAHEHLKKCGAELRKKIEKENYQPYHLTQKQRNERAGINNEYQNSVTMHLSSHVHTHPFSVFQLVDFKAGDPECLGLMSMGLQYSTAYLAKAIVGVSAMFKPMVPSQSNEVSHLLELWERIIGNGIKSC